MCFQSSVVCRRLNTCTANTKWNWCQQWFYYILRLRLACVENGSAEKDRAIEGKTEKISHSVYGRAVNTIAFEFPIAPANSLHSCHFRIKCIRYSPPLPARSSINSHSRPTRVNYTRHGIAGADDTSRERKICIFAPHLVGAGYRPEFGITDEFVLREHFIIQTFFSLFIRSSFAENSQTMHIFHRIVQKLGTASAYSPAHAPSVWIFRANHFLFSFFFSPFWSCVCCVHFIVVALFSLLSF